MPSGHATFASGLATWLILEWIVFHDKASFKQWRFYSIVRGVGIFIAPFIAISRHYLNYHSVAQICFGALGGFVWTTVFFSMMVILIHKNEGKDYHSRTVQFLKKIKFTCNLLSFHEQPAQGDCEAQTPVEVAKQFILPIRERFLFLFKKAIQVPAKLEAVKLEPAKI